MALLYSQLRLAELADGYERRRRGGHRRRSDDDHGTVSHRAGRFQVGRLGRRRDYVVVAKDRGHEHCDMFTQGDADLDGDVDGNDLAIMAKPSLGSFAQPLDGRRRQRAGRLSPSRQRRACWLAGALLMWIGRRSIARPQIAMNCRRRSCYSKSGQTLVLSRRDDYEIYFKLYCITHVAGGPGRGPAVVRPRRIQRLRHWINPMIDQDPTGFDALHGRCYGLFARHSLQVQDCRRETSRPEVPVIGPTTIAGLYRCDWAKSISICTTNDLGRRLVPQ